MAPLVVSRSNEETRAVGNLFSGLNFFLIQRLPQRSVFIQRIEANGGRVVRLEKQADHVIADPYRKDSPPGSISYKFIDESIRHGELQDPTDHLAGPAQGAVREVGSGVPGKGTRTPFTAEDDRVLWQWVQQRKAQGGLVKGNEIYKQLEAHNPRHTAQSWRDRYIKKLMDRPPAGVEVTVAANAPPSPPTAQDEQEEIPERQATPTRKSTSPKKKRKQTTPDSGFTDADLEMLITHAHQIERIPEDNVEDAWNEWVKKERPDHSPQAWRTFYEDKVRATYYERKAAGKIVEPVEEETPDTPSTRDGTKNDDDEVQGPLANLGRKTSPVPAETPIRPRSSSSQKRKRETPTPRAKTTYGHKKQKHDDSGVFAQADSDEEPVGEIRQPETRSQTKTPTQKPSPPRPSTQTIEIPEDDDDDGVEQAQAQDKLEAHKANSAAEIESHQVHHLEPNVVIPASETSREAQTLFDEEVLGIPRAEVPKDASTSNFLTSEVNREADQQLGRESRERESDRLEEDGDDDNPLPSSRMLLSEAGDGIRDVHMADLSADVLEPEGLALTEANLASQQAQHKEQLLRGTDLVEDDEDDEEAQNTYIRFLQDVTHQHSPTVDRQTARPQPQVDVDIEDDEPELPAVPVQLNVDALAADALPPSSQQDIEDVLEDVSHWPDSPKRSERPVVPQVQDESAAFETQVAYPKLPSEPLEVTQLEEQQDHWSQRPPPAEVVYPSLPAQVADSTEKRQAHEQEVAPSPSAAGTSPELLDKEDSYVLIDDVSLPTDPQRGDAEDEIDLSMPEPEGGWDLPSSPAKAFGSQARQPSPRQDLDPVGSEPEGNEQLNEDEDVPEPAPIEQDVEDEEMMVPKQPDVADISPSSSSSSAKSSEPQASVNHANSWRALETQDIVNAETQQVDLDMPPPPDSDEESDDLPSSPPDGATFESQRNLAETQQLSDEDLSSYIDTKVVYGYKEDSIIRALKFTSMRPELAELVLLEEKLGKGPPDDVAGVWSEGEDEAIESGDAARIKKVEDKHGWEEIVARMQFLQTWREEDD